MSAAAIDVWAVDLGRPEALPQASALLAPEEAARAARYRSPHHRGGFVTRRVVLRRLLAGHLGIPLQAVRLAATRQGRPFLPDGRLDFSAASSGALVLVALARGGRVGVDVEALQPVAGLDAVLRLSCTAADRRYVDAGAAAARAERFLQVWTAKEAYLKALGCGLAVAPDQVALRPARHAPAATGWDVAAVAWAPADVAVGALAVPAGSAALVRLRRVALADLPGGAAACAGEVPGGLDDPARWPPPQELALRAAFHVPGPPVPEPGGGACPLGLPCAGRLDVAPEHAHGEPRRAARRTAPGGVSPQEVGGGPATS